MSDTPSGYVPPEDRLDLPQAVRLKEFVQQHQPGQCKMLSKGDACDCLLCCIDYPQAAHWDAAAMRECVGFALLDGAQADADLFERRVSLGRRFGRSFDSSAVHGSEQLRLGGLLA